MSPLSVVFQTFIFLSPLLATATPAAMPAGGIEPSAPAPCRQACAQPLPPMFEESPLICPYQASWPS